MKLVNENRDLQVKLKKAEDAQKKAEEALKKAPKDLSSEVAQLKKEFDNLRNDLDNVDKDKGKLLKKLEAKEAELKRREEDDVKAFETKDAYIKKLESELELSRFEAEKKHQLHEKELAELKTNSTNTINSVARANTAPLQLQASFNILLLYTVEASYTAMLRGQKSFDKQYPGTESCSTFFC